MPWNTCAFSAKLPSVKWATSGRPEPKTGCKLKIPNDSILFEAPGESRYERERRETQVLAKERAARKALAKRQDLSEKVALESADPVSPKQMPRSFNRGRHPRRTPRSQFHSFFQSFRDFNSSTISSNLCNRRS